jgi:phosphoribosylaminoimidazolecarboxamide formyltransferase/IMP cyclohydrolase
LDTLPNAQAPGLHLKSISGGYLVQSRDSLQISATALRVVTKRAPTPEEIEDLLFAFKVAKFVKSNAIVFAKNQATYGIGAGQMSRIDATRLGISKAQEAGLDLKSAVAASDAFFPFADGVLAAAASGISALIQPGGSIRDDEVIAAADDAGLAMVFTDIRHFRH